MSPTSKLIRILTVDDHPLLREGIATLDGAGRILDRRVKRLVSSLFWGLIVMVAVNERHAAPP